MAGSPSAACATGTRSRPCRGPHSTPRAGLLFAALVQVDAARSAPFQRRTDHLRNQWPRGHSHVGRYKVQGIVSSIELSQIRRNHNLTISLPSFRVRHLYTRIWGTGQKKFRQRAESCVVDQAAGVRGSLLTVAVIR